MPFYWPKSITEWHDDNTGYLSVPFTWLLPAVKAKVLQRHLYVDRWVVGGPAVKLLPNYLSGLDVQLGDDMPGVLQRINPQATRTTIGCIRRCGFCGVRTIEGNFRELPDWPDQPVVCDNNLLAASEGHFTRVMQRLRRHGWCDFNQGLDARLLTPFHATLIAAVGKPIIRLALDDDGDRKPWADAVDRLRTAGVAKSRIRSYVLCGYRGSPEEDKSRCEYVESMGSKALPMWFHALDALTANEVTPRQQSLGWTHRKRRELMCWYYWHRTLEARG